MTIAIKFYLKFWQCHTIWGTILQCVSQHVLKQYQCISYAIIQAFLTFMQGEFVRLWLYKPVTDAGRSTDIRKCVFSSAVASGLKMHVYLTLIAGPEGKKPKLGLDCFRSLKHVGWVAMETRKLKAKEPLMSLKKRSTSTNTHIHSDSVSYITARGFLH